eukprot:Skav218680  [mRNA]  locus=scaffold3220:3970:21624:- [translate_table: standard]
MCLVLSLAQSRGCHRRHLGGAFAMSVETEKYCTILIHYEKGVPPTSEELAKKLESKKDQLSRDSETVQAEALEELILLMINGESYPKLLMTIIRFVCTSRDHRVKKLLQIYWEIVEKTKDTGDLKEEMILVCNALRNDLMHANEILEPLKEAVLRNLSHRHCTVRMGCGNLHSYVRRNAVMCVFSIVKSFGVEVLPEASDGAAPGDGTGPPLQAPEDIEQLLLVEGDLSTKRNAFLMLVNCDQERSERLVCRSTSVNKGRFLRIAAGSNEFGLLPFFPRGCYVSISDCGKIKQVLAEYAECMLPKDSLAVEDSNGKYECQCIVFSDAGRILGLGDLGCWGMGIPIGKLDLYTEPWHPAARAGVCAGFNPYKTIPVIIDAGCSDPSGNSANLNIRDHDLYTGALSLDIACLHQGALVNTAYYGSYSLIDEFMTAAAELFSRKCLLQFEDDGGMGCCGLLRPLSPTLHQKCPLGLRRGSDSEHPVERSSLRRRNGSATDFKIEICVTWSLRPSKTCEFSR